jgi:hypothetical protein
VVANVPVAIEEDGLTKTDDEGDTITVEGGPLFEDRVDITTLLEGFTVTLGVVVIDEGGATVLMDDGGGVAVVEGGGALQD